MRSAWKTLIRAYPFTRGRIRLISMARRRISGMVLADDRSGNHFLLDLGNLIDSLIYLQGSFEEDQVERLARHAKERGCTQFIDVGANIGVFSLRFARDPAMRGLWAFEPDPRNRGQLLTNLWLNDLHERVIVSNVALAAETGQATFYVNTLVRRKGDLSYNTSSSSLLKAGSPLHRPINVPTARLDEIVLLRGEKIALKIDVEGAEMMVLQGARNLLENNRCLVMVEIWNNKPGALEKGLQFMAAMGYQPLGDDEGSGNYLFANDPAK